MKTIICKILLVALVFSGSQSFAGKPKFDIHKEKTINKVYQVNSDAGIDITNKYGSIFVTTWNEDRIALDIVIKVHGKNESRVLERLNKISVDINPLKHLVSATTVLESVSGSNISMEINYTIKIPKRGSITLNNHYGNIILDRIEGNSKIECRYGNIMSEELNGESNLLKLKYCDKSTFGYAKNAIIDAGYSKLVITKSQNVKLNSDYSNFTAKEIGNLQYDSNYGDLTVASVGNLKGTGNYLTLKFGTVNGVFDIGTKYSSIAVNNLSARAKNFTIGCAYTNVDIKYDADYAFDYEISLKYGNLSAAGLNNQIKNESGKDSFYKGFYKSAGDNKLAISSSYGSIKLTKN